LDMFGSLADANWRPVLHSSASLRDRERALEKLLSADGIQHALGLWQGTGEIVESPCTWHGNYSLG
jgi:hypothetical protein